MKKRNPDTYYYEYDQLSSEMFDDYRTYQSLTDFSLRGNGENYKADDGDPTLYKLNSKGFRSSEFEAVDLLIAGCSQTFGLGVEEERTWGACLAKMLNMSYANISKCGASNQTIIQSIFSYIRLYGKPKIVCLNLPSLYRFTLPTRSDICSYPYINGREVPAVLSKNDPAVDSSKISVDDMNMAATGTELDDVDNWPLYAKRPYNIVKVLPYEAALYLTMMSLNYLIDYCKAADISLVFTTWYPDAEKILTDKYIRTLNDMSEDFNKLDMSSYVVLDNLEKFMRGPENIVNCHKNTHGWSDWDRGLDNAEHMGAHQHLHFAELFYKKLQSIL